jgi:hypothetical protein
LNKASFAELVVGLAFILLLNGMWIDLNLPEIILKSQFFKVGLLVVFYFYIGKNIFYFGR